MVNRLNKNMGKYHSERRKEFVKALEDWARNNSIAKSGDEATHKTIAKLEKQFQALNGNKAKVKAKGATKAKKIKTSKKNTGTSNQEA
jgi:hypothetical protein